MAEPATHPAEPATHSAEPATHSAEISAENFCLENYLFRKLPLTAIDQMANWHWNSESEMVCSESELRTQMLAEYD